MMNWGARSSKERVMELMAPAEPEEPKVTSINIRFSRRIVDGEEAVVYSADVGWGMGQADYTDVDKFCADLIDTIKAAAKDL